MRVYGPGQFGPDGDDEFEFRDGQWLRNGQPMSPSEFQAPPPGAPEFRPPELTVDDLVVPPPASDEKYPALKVADRCDRCGAQAFVRVVTPKGDLLFCCHHYRKHEPEILAHADGEGLASYEVLDERHRLPTGRPAL